MLESGKFIKHIKQLCLTLMMLCLLCLTAVSYAAHEPTHVYKVGFFYLPGINVYDDNDKLDGYDYELMERLNFYCDDRYEYVGYGESQEQLLEKLGRGEIDLLPGVVKTSELEQRFAFSDKSIGVVATSIAARQNDERFTKSGVPQGKHYTIGLLKTSYLNANFEKRVKELGFTYTPVYYGTFKELEQALQNKEIDLLVAHSMQVARGTRIVDILDYQEFHIAFNKQDQTVKKHMDELLEDMDNGNPTWRRDLYENHSKDIASSDVLHLSAEELAYLEQLRKEGRVLKVLPNPNRAPLSKWNGTKFEGIMIDSFAEIAKRLGLKYELMPVRNRQDFDKGWQSTEAEIVLGFYEDYQMPYKDYRLTSPYLKMDLAYLYRKDAEGKIGTYAMLQSYSGKMAAIFSRAKPQGAKIVTYPNSDMCMDAVFNGEADATVIFSYAAQQELLKDNRNLLAMRVLPDSSMGISLGVSKYESPLLASALQKAVTSIKGSYIKQYIIDHTSYKHVEMTPIDYMHNHPFVGMSWLVLILLCCFAYYLKSKRVSTARLIEEKNNQLEEKQDNIIALQKMLGSGTWMANYDENGELKELIFSQEFREIFDLQDEALLPDIRTAWMERVHVDDREGVNNKLQSCLNDDACENIMHGPYRFLNGSNEYRWVRATGRIVRWPNGKVKRLIGYAVDITDDNDADFLTGKLNAEGFNTAVERYLANQEETTGYSILYFNIRSFKAVNEMWGLEEGDELLKDYAAKLEQSALKPLFIGRRGDHFLVFVRNSAAMTEAIEELCYFRYHSNAGTLTVHSRCGIYNVGDSEVDVGRMVDRAKLAKDNITNEYVYPYAVYDETIRDKYVTEAFATAELDRAIVNEEFKIYYQPIVDCKSGKLASAEALVRWEHPQRGLVMPGAFIPALENSGYISRLDRYVMEHVLAFYKQHLEQKLPLVPISVKFFWMVFYDAKLLEWMTDNMRNNNLQNELLRAEVTESAYSALHGNVKGLLDLMQENKVTLVLDDFGSGVASLDMLQKYAFDILKIDMSFTRKLGENPRTANMLKAVIDMCHQLGIKVVAEGVETIEQLEFYRENSCDYIQGYYFYKPMPEAAFAELLAEQAEQNALLDYNLKEVHIPQSYYKAQLYFPSEAMQLRSNMAADKVLELIGANSGVGAVSGLYDNNRTICYFSNLTAELLGYTNEEFIAFTKGSYLNVIIPEDREAYLKSNERESYYRVLAKDGSVLQIKELRADVIAQSGEVQWVATIRKIDNVSDEELTRIIDVRKAAETDSFTGLLTKKTFFDKLEKLITINPDLPYSMLIFDMDNFKTVNDVCGHLRGDEVLLLMTRILKHTFRSGDLIARFGGDEFMVFLHNTNNKAVVQDRVERVMRSLRESIFFSKLNRPCTVSAGAYCSSGRHLNVMEIFDNADKALYDAKAAGKNQLKLFEEK